MSESASSSSALPAAAIPAALLGADADAVLVKRFLHARVDELNSTSGSLAVRDNGVSLVSIYNAVIKNPDVTFENGAREKVIELLTAHGVTYQRVVKAYINKGDELDRLSVRLDSILGSVTSLTQDLKPCTCVSGNCAGCACSRKSGYAFCTDRCGCNEKCVRGQYKDDGIGKRLNEEAAALVRKEAKKKEKMRALAKLENELAADAEKRARKEMREKKKRAEEELQRLREEERLAKDKRKAQQDKKKKKKKKKAESSSDSSSDSESGEEAE
jgi:hypothetical protein